MNMFTPKKEKQFSTNTRRFTMNMKTPKKEKQFSTNIMRFTMNMFTPIWFKIIKMENERKKNSLIWDYEERKWYNTDTRRFTMNMFTPKKEKQFSTNTRRWYTDEYD